MPDATRAFAAVTPALQRETIAPRTLWAVESSAPPLRLPRAAYLLPVYDEYLIAYKDRDLAMDPRTREFDPTKRDDFGHYLVIDGRFVGTWRWVSDEDAIDLRLMPYCRLSSADDRLLRRAAARLAAFTGRRVTMSRATA